MENNDTDDLIIYIRWFDFLEWLLPVTGNFSPAARQPLGVRIEDITLNIAEELAEARYVQAGPEQLETIFPKFERLRLLCRLCFRLKHFSTDEYRFATHTIDETRKLLGSWISSKATRSDKE